MLTDGWDNSAGSWQWAADGATLLFVAEVRARINLYAIAVAGGTPRELHRGGALAGLDVTRDGDVVFQRHAVDAPPELAVIKTDGTGFRYLTSVNKDLMATTAMGRMEEMTFTGAGGDAVQMFVVFPPGFDAAKKYPLVQLVHGGPVGTFGDAFSFRWHPHAFAAPGYVVAMVNFHGSSSFGQPWIESILGAHADKPFADVMAATDFLIAKGYVDQTKMAAAGGSYGGYLVNWIAGHTNRFKAIVSHAGVYSLTGQFASDGTEGRQHSYGGYPFTNLANVEKWSPNRFSTGFNTPMLVLHGERDFRVPVTQGLELYGVLAAKGIPARLVYYPDENHWILKPQNSKHWYGEVLGWLKKYLRRMTDVNHGMTDVNHQGHRGTEELHREQSLGYAGMSPDAWASSRRRPKNASVRPLCLRVPVVNVRHPDATTSKDDTADAVFQYRHVEVDEEAEAFSRRLEVRQDLCNVYGLESVDALDFDDDCVLDQQDRADSRPQPGLGR